MATPADTAAPTVRVISLSTLYQRDRHILEIAEGRESVMQPIHWLLQIGAVLARIHPDGAEENLAMLQALDFGVADDPLILRRACQLAIELQQHLFDTLYHAIALQTPSATLVTADDRYLRAGGKLGHIVSLADWRPDEDGNLADETRNQMLFVKQRIGSGTPVMT